ncbi:hypothetical protein VBZ67_12370 [Campylobacter concisus]
MANKQIGPSDVNKIHVVADFIKKMMAGMINLLLCLKIYLGFVRSFIGCIQQA